MKPKSRIKKGCGCLLVAILLLCFAGAIAVYVNKPRWKDEYGQLILSAVDDEMPNATNIRPCSTDVQSFIIVCSS